MITFDRLGHAGRLGNQMWEIASTLGIAMSRKEHAYLGNWDYRPVYSVPDEHFTLGITDNCTRADDTSEVAHLSPSERVYLQDYRLWWEHREKILPMFALSDWAFALLETWVHVTGLPDGPLLAVHVRRGDNTQDDHIGIFPVPTDAYYYEAVAKFPYLTPVVFTDDAPYCRDHFPEWTVVAGTQRPPDSSPSDYWASPPDDWLDLALMAHLCSNHVLSNSTYGWWGAVLGQDDEAIFPDPWYGPKLGHIDWRSNMMLPGWTPIRAD